jgi:hypothetical protein
MSPACDILSDMNREELDDLVDKWHDSDTKMSLHEYLGMSREEYAVWTEFDILPDEEITREKFLALRSDAYRWANDADNYLTENRRYKEAVSELRAVAEDDWITDILDRNNV